MGLDVGVVKITYIDRPSESVRDFLTSSVMQPEDEWGGTWDGNVIFECSKRRAFARARRYARHRGLTEQAKREIEGWLRQLPWEDDMTMLHLSW